MDKGPRCWLRYPLKVERCSKDNVAAESAIVRLTYRTSSWHVSILRSRSMSPMMREASRISRKVSSRRMMQRTIVPSPTSVSCIISLNVLPHAHSYTTSTRPVLSVDASSSVGSWCDSCTAATRSAASMMRL